MSKNILLKCVNLLQVEPVKLVSKESWVQCSLCCIWYNIEAEGYNCPNCNKENHKNVNRSN